MGGHRRAGICEPHARRMGAMNLLDVLPTGALIGLDTAPFIYQLEAHPTFGPLVNILFAQRIAAPMPSNRLRDRSRPASHPRSTRPRGAAGGP